MKNHEANRQITHVSKGIPATDGAGVTLTRIIGSPELDMLDPFLLLDSFASDDPNDYIAGFPLHPHRGFETVTYMLAGKMRHEDNTGRSGVIGPGGVQWMTAGRGIIHSEMPEQEEGLLHGFQLWVNLPATEKMSEPHYREYDASEIPIEKREAGAEVRVITGTTEQGTKGPVTDVITTPLYLDVRLMKSSRFTETIPVTHNAFVYVVKGVVAVIGEQLEVEEKVSAGFLGVLGDGNRVELVGLEDETQLLLIAGCRLGEPVARGGPFVMNTRAELTQAVRDYQSGQF
ncbi:MAG: quercetin 2,3-dioxygenase [Gammaproteobacteria bacterium]|nr:quercetin 2,3-dioxygenase [Gammaproteobacteria bacterium]